MTPYLYLLIVCLLLSAFFSGIEIAFVSANRLKLEVDSKRQGLTSRLLARWAKRPSHFIGAVLVGNNIALVFFGICIAVVLQPMFNADFSARWPFVVMIAQTLISTVVVLFIGEFWPKALFRLRPNALLRFFAVPFTLLSFLFFPIVMLVTFISRSVLQAVFKTRLRETGPEFSKSDLENLVKESVPPEERSAEIDPDLFENALYLTQVKARECMIPRPEIVGVDVSQSIDELKEAFIDSKLSRLVVFDQGVDQVLGYVHHQSLWKNPDSIRAIIFPMPVVPETMPAIDILSQMIKQRKSVSLVVEEFGGTAGIVTMEDILEEIFGEIKDEHDDQEFVETRIAENDFIFSGRLEIDYINDTYNLELPQGDYETLAGLILNETGKIPLREDRISVGDFQFTIVKASHTRIETVRVKKTNAER